MRPLLRLIRATAVVFVVIVAVLAVTLFALSTFVTRFPGVEPILHAGGEIDGARYTNSLAALDRNSALGFTLFEMDFQRTADGALVCGHNWTAFNERPNLDAFLEARRAQLHPACTADEFAAWMDRHPNVLLVSDAKEDVLSVNTVLHEEAGQRLVAQAYSAKDVCDLRAAGIDRVILTIYRLPYSMWDLVRVLMDPCIRSGPPLEAVTMPISRVYTGQAFVAKLITGRPVYAHTVNQCARVAVQRWLGVDGFYSDGIDPRRCRGDGSLGPRG